MLIDVNAFFGHWPYWPLPHTSGQDLLRLMDQHGIDRAVVTSLRGLHGDWREANAETLALARSHPDRFAPLACMSPMNGGGAAALRELVEQGFRGIRLYPLLLQGYSLCSPFVVEVCTTAGQLGVPVVIPTRPMMNFRFPTLPVEQVETLAERFRDTRFILSGPNYLSEFRAAVEAMQRHENLLIETSCMQGFRAVAQVVQAIASDRILFGTGAVLHYPACNVAKLAHAKITPCQRQAVAWYAAHRLFRIHV